MTRDRNKGIDNITYNHLNLPSTISINGTDSQGNSQSGIITYVYDATGMKLEKIVSDNIQQSTISTQYSGAYIYEDSNGNEQLKMISHPEGYLEPVYNTTKSISKFSIQTQSTSSSNYQYVYTYKDHLGNVRLTYADTDGNGSINPSTEIISEKNYYPFGLEHKGYNNIVSSNGNSTAQNFKYNGKEHNQELGLDWYDYGARNYDPALGRWMNIDPMAKKYFNQSPYTYALNSPVYFVDPDGREVDVTELADSEDKDDQWLLFSLMVDLADISGQEVTKSTKDGKTTLTGKGECESDCNEASAFISHLLDPNGETISVSGVTTGSRGYTDGTVELDASQIFGMQVGLSENGYDSKAMSVGFAFLHETLHTKYGSDFFTSGRDNSLKGHDGTFNDASVLGIDEGSPTVNIINRFRRDAYISTTRSHYGFSPGTLWVEKDGNEEVLKNIKKVSPTENK